jgi:hypothetical protein
MTVVNAPLTTLDYVTGTGISTGVSTETTVISTDVITANAPQLPGSGSGGASPQTVRPVKIEANLVVTAGTGTTALVIRCRQGVGTGGAQVGATQTVTLAAGASGQFAFVFRDSSGVPYAAGGTAYTITITQTGGSAAGTVNTVDAEVKQ